MDASCKSKKVLVIDDDESIVELIQNILKQHNYQPITATHYTSALDALEHENPDLLLLDLAMPTVDGASLLEFIREQGNQVPVIVVSAHLTGENAVELARYGVDTFLWKPFKISDLMHDIERAIGPPPGSRAGCLGDAPGLSEDAAPGSFRIPSGRGTAS